MDSDLYQLVYCSRNLIKGLDADVTAELQAILASSRKNNPAKQITGALLYNEGSFVQVLEGPLASVESVFEMIQRDPRHTEVTVVHSGKTEARDFPEWSMAFTGSNSSEQMPRAAAAFDSVYSNAAGAGEKMLDTLRALIVQENDWILLDAAAS